MAGTPREVMTPGILDRMTDVMTHRGPDDRGTYSAPGVALGVRRLSIVDPEGGHQPVLSEDEQVVALHNGELYNQGALRNTLLASGHQITSRCDSELLPHLYEEFGTSFCRRLRGMFGLAVWDGRRRRALLARDRLGIKPLYWARRQDVLVFASELKSLLASGLVNPQLDYQAIASFLTLGFFPRSATPIAGVHKLLPGEQLLVGPDVWQLERYWSHPLPVPDRSLTSGDHAARLLEKLEESVCLRLMADVPLGAMLSGGLDSSLIVGLMARNSSKAVPTFSIGFADAGAANELEDARLVASRFGTEHHELTLSFADQPVSLEELVWSLDEPLGDLSALGFHALSRLAAEEVKVALSGQGADELLGGYRKHRVAMLAAYWGKLPQTARRSATLPLRFSRGELRRLAAALTAETPESRLLAMSSVLDAEVRPQLFVGPLARFFAEAAGQNVARLCNELAPDEHPLASTLYIDAQLALVDDMLHYYDRTSMAHSLEVRVPFLDHELVELCATIPPELKVRATSTKDVLKQAAAGILPNRIINKPKVGFFAAGNRSAAGWFEAHARAALDEYLFDPAARTGEFIHPGVVRELLRAKPTGRRTAKLLMSLLMLEIWLSTYLPRALSAHETRRGPSPSRSRSADRSGEKLRRAELVRTG